MTAFPLPQPGEVVFLYDSLSPYAFMASTRIEANAKALDVNVRWQPVFLAGLLKAAQNVAPIMGPSANKARWAQRDAFLQVEALGLAFTWPETFPQNSVQVMRALVVIEDQEVLVRATHAAYGVIYGQGGSLEDTPSLVAAFNKAGLDGEALMARAATEEAKSRLRALTDQAVELGAFGVPDFLVRGKDGETELFFGNDRLHLALLRAAGRPLTML